MSEQSVLSFMDWRTASLHPKWGILYYSIPNASQELRARCRKRMTEKYGENPPELIISRLEHELWCLTDRPWSHSAYYLLLSSLAEKCDSLAVPHTTLGCGGTSFAAYLTGITETNPLPPHKYCLDCGFVEFVDETEYESGFDLWSNPQALGDCPLCGAKLTGDGHNLDSTNLFDDDGGMLPYFEISVPIESQFVLFDFLGDLGEVKTGLTREEAEEIEHNCIHSRIDCHRIQIHGNCELSQIRELEKKPVCDHARFNWPRLICQLSFLTKTILGFPTTKRHFGY